MLLYHHFGPHHLSHQLDQNKSPQKKTSPSKGESQFLGVFFGIPGPIWRSHLHPVAEPPRKVELGWFTVEIVWDFVKVFRLARIPTWLPNRCPRCPPPKKGLAGWWNEFRVCGFLHRSQKMARWASLQQGPFWISIGEWKHQTWVFERRVFTNYRMSRQYDAYISKIIYDVILFNPYAACIIC